MHFDTVIAWDNGRIYFFADDQYWAWDIASRTVPTGYPRAISDGWSGLFFDHLDAALWGNAGKAYFFRGTEYTRYLVASDRAEPGFPQTYAPHWPGLWPSGFDAAVNWNNGKAYFFRGSDYLRYDMAADRADPGYPLPIDRYWPGIWAHDIDAAIALPGTDIAYVFQGEQCIRYDMTADAAAAGYPVDIVDEFPGLPVAAPPPRPPPPPQPPPPPPATSDWFVASTAHPGTGGNSITAFTDGDAYFADLVTAIRTAAGPDAFVELAAWDLQAGFELVPGDPTSTLTALLSDASARGVAVRALLNRHQPNPLGKGTVSGYDNTVAAALINALPTGAALHDDRYLLAGTHHQKFAVVNSSTGLTAYSGGMDPNPNRLLAGPGAVHLHDVQCQVTGPAAFDHHVLFARRWQDNPASAGLPGIIAPAMPPAAGSLQAQVASTFGNGTAHPGIPAGTGATAPGYTFAPTGDTSVRDLVLHAISKAKSFVYLEDQYLVDAAISSALVAALATVDRLIILLPDTPSVNGELRQGWRRRKAFIDPLLAAAPGKVAVNVGTKFYIHSKTWVFDDVFAIVGSANCNRRGYTHDGEQAVGVFDSVDDGNWVHRLRMALWAKHLGLPAAAVRDPIASAANWWAPPAGADITAYAVNGGPDSAGFPLNTDAAWDNLLDPRGA